MRKRATFTVDYEESAVHDLEEAVTHLREAHGMTVKLNVAWMSNPQYLAQVGHAFGAYSVGFTLGVFLLTSDARLYVALLATGIVLAGLKEFVFDTATWGEGDSWADSAMDFAFYLIGATVGVVMTFLWRAS